ncbi:methyltransferase family protein [Stackebrandtia endophytica]|uniref:Methyltransferase family protein n=2 Tax=Stackebrandtia endophytica TaxID=1496996 RepID=A0A543B0F7_9ACTN|nr:methyltransferase family protein [Stackebrandtia endophytica]
MTMAETDAGSRLRRLHWYGDLYSEAIRSGRGPLFLCRADGWMLPLEIERWCAAADEVDQEVLRRCHGTVLDIGCGPGRFAAALRARRHEVLGIDVSAVAVQRTRDNGANALRLSVYDRLPGEGDWDTTLLMDGNIGIGGDPAALLRRIADITVPNGLLLVEVATVDVDERVTVHLADSSGGRGDHFAWARVGVEALSRLARPIGWRLDDHWTVDGRAFAALRAPSPPQHEEGRDRDRGRGLGAQPPADPRQ